MARKPIEETPMLPTRIEDTPDSAFLNDLSMALRFAFIQYGGAINDDLIAIPDWITEISAAYSMLGTDRIVISSPGGGGYTVSLPLAVDAEPHIYVIKQMSAGTTTIARSGSDLLEGVPTPVALTNAFQLATLISDRASNWYLLHLGLP